MISPRRKSKHPAGASLVEAMIAVGVLAVAIPLVFGALAEAGRSGEQSGTDSRSTAILAECMGCVGRIRAQKPGWFEPAAAGVPFPPSGTVWALAFAEDGHLIGRVEKTDYENGLRELNGQSVRYLATLRATASPATVATGSLAANEAVIQPLRLAISLEHPATAAASRRKVQVFHSLLR